MMKNKYRSEMSLELMNAADAMLRKSAEKVVGQHVYWQRQSIKLLVFLNGAGLAAAATVMSGAHFPEVQLAAIYAARLCTVGLLLVTALTIWMWSCSWVELRVLARFSLKFLRDEATLLELSSNVPSRWISGLQIVMASLSFGAFIVAMYFTSHPANFTVVGSH